jgi:hypothetical protein
MEILVKNGATIVPLTSVGIFYSPLLKRAP